MNATRLFLKLLKERGIDRIFMVSGTDYAAFIEQKVEDPSLPEFEVIPHEITAASAALGYSLGGKIGTVAVHTVPGTANALGIIINAYTSRIPLIVIAGRSPYTESGSVASRNLRIHWTQEAKDQGGILRQWVKWDFEVRDPNQIPEVVSRAIQIATSEPKGPVYVEIPREVSIAEAKERKVNAASFEPGPTRESVEKAKRLIEEAENPVIITWRAGRRKEWFNSLKRFADSSGIPVINYVGETVNYPTDGPMAISRSVSDSDLLIAVEVEVPWIPKREKVEGKVIKVDVEPSYSYIPFYGFPCDLCIQSTPSAFFDQLDIKNEERKAKILEEKSLQDKKREEEIQSLKLERKIHPKVLSYYIGKIREKINATIIDEYPLNPKYCKLSFDEYYGDLSEGHLGWALGSTIGYKMATGKDVITTVGDGSFIFGVPEAFYYAQIPSLVVIYDNGGWLATAEAVEEVYPEGLAKAKKVFPGADFKRYDIGGTVKAFNGYFRLVESIDEIELALTEGIQEVKKGKIAVVQVIVEKTR
ncbi:acetolactate synthase catalytic subunit [Candidatus Acidianus copahuensis]|uniref:2-oxoacid oxidoreductase (ferredoxin) n=1 Tax=Candidatus Acidianus copahuensis TaxID=1160895 RepID=A0A031LN50_9CREN|nr:thiamine pyrophosphate-requiring protein [Candidatus Acidianus copahuensis]EZQ07078.1 acetolactate synthase catalytic subunit [Candidatus Acidianus copahuensis]